MYESFIAFVRDLYKTSDFIPLHEPQFLGNEKEYLLEAVDSTYVSSVGHCVETFENTLANYTGVKHAIATVNGTAALHVALKLADVREQDQVITQSLNFVAVCNAIYYCNGEPIFLDVNKESLSLCPDRLEEFLSEYCDVRNDGTCWNKKDDRPVRACVPMHTFGFPADLDRLKEICDAYNIILIEDSAESLGSFYKHKHTGSVGKLSILSFNGNKIITTGGGGMVLTNNDALAHQARHLTTTAKILKGWSWQHDQIAFNYRLPNLNAALGIGQMENITKYLDSKRKIANKYHNWGNENSLQFVKEQEDTKANYWLNTIIAENREARDIFLKETNENNIGTRPAWKPMHKLNFNKNAVFSDLQNTEWLYDRLVNVPSSPIVNL